MSDPPLDLALETTAEAIADLEIRGAATIAAVESTASQIDGFESTMRAAGRRLHETRPTAVSLPNALRDILQRMAGETVGDLRASVIRAADEFVDRLDRAQTDLGSVDHVLVGADSIAADDSVINKIGTSGLAVIARDRGVPVMAAAQTIKLHPDTLTGHTVEIEMRDEREVIDDDSRNSIGEITVENPAFDVTPPRYVDAIITERGQFPPESIVILIDELFGESVDEPWEEPTTDHHSRAPSTDQEGDSA